MEETNRIEFKRELTKELDIEKEVVAFLNYREGGIIYIGVDDNGTPIGVNDIDGDMLRIKDRIRKGILPSPMGLFDVTADTIDDVKVIKIFVASGSEKPYYKAHYGLSERGCYMRVGTAAEPMTTIQIEDMFASRVRNSLRKISAPRQDLTFVQLQIYYNGKGKTLGDDFAKTLMLYTDDGKYNYIAYLLADVNDVSIKFAKYAGTDRDNLIENNEYGYCCLLKAADAVMERFKIENIITTTKSYPFRIDTPLWDTPSIREMVLNACVHNDFFGEVPPKFELFCDHLEITSTGGLPSDLKEDEFFKGVSVPRNKELIRIFRDVDMGEGLGSGMRLIMKQYGRECFEFMPHFLRVSIPFCSQKSAETSKQINQDTIDKITGKNARENTKENTRENTKERSNGKNKKELILSLLDKNPAVTALEIADSLGLSENSVRHHLRTLKASGVIVHKGPTKKGYWLVIIKK